MKLKCSDIGYCLCSSFCLFLSLQFENNKLIKNCFNDSRNMITILPLVNQSTQQGLFSHKPIRFSSCDKHISHVLVM